MRVERVRTWLGSGLGFVRVGVEVRVEVGIELAKEG